MSTLWIARGFGRAPPGLCPAHLVESELSVWSVTRREHIAISKFAVHNVFGAGGWMLFRHRGHTDGSCNLSTKTRNV